MFSNESPIQLEPPLMLKFVKEHSDSALEIRIPSDKPYYTRYIISNGL